MLLWIATAGFWLVLLAGFFETVANPKRYGYASRWSAFGTSFIGLWLAFVATMVAHAYFDPAATGQVAAAPTSAPDLARIDGRDVFTCDSLETLERIVKYVQQKDRDAFVNLVTTKHATGECRDIDDNTEVYVMERSFWKPVAKIRRPGSTVETWVASGFLKRGS